MVVAAAAAAVRHGRPARMVKVVRDGNITWRGRRDERKEKRILVGKQKVRRSLRTRIIIIPLVTTVPVGQSTNLW